MIFNLNRNIEHILVLGAGASVDYGLPTWRDLSTLIKEKINKDTENQYKYKKEILVWVDKVGEGRKYKTIDECIKDESASKEYHSNGHDIEDQIFRVIKDIFNEKGKDSEEGWIRTLNEKILFNNGNLQHEIAFINYNYDNVLDKNLLNYAYLPRKYQIFNYKKRLSSLSQAYVKALYPHGNFFSGEKLEPPSHIYKESNTMKSGNEEYIDAVSCYESERHIVEKDYGSIKLYILGLGEGLKINLSNIYFRNPISEIHVTIKNPNKIDEILNFLSKQYDFLETEIKVYKTCKDLVSECFIS